MNRAESLRQLGDGHLWDVLIVGGGATGLGAAVEAATRGYQTLLVEQGDFAQATSSRSTKLIHGGVRYLQQGNLRLVREALRERARLLRNAPGLVHPVSMAIPLQNRWERLYLGFGLKLYDALAGAEGLGHARYLPPAELRRRLEGFDGPAAAGGLLFEDGQFDDARLALSLARTASKHGATLLNYARVVTLAKRGEKVSGAMVEDGETGQRHEVRARTVINATGVFTDAVRRLDEPATPHSVTPSQGIHLVLPPKFLPGKTAILIPRTADGRVLFAIPWHGRVLLGTTDTPMTEALLEPRALPEEIDFLVEHAWRFLGWQITPADVLSLFAGLRPLAGRGARTAALARDHTITIAPSGLVSVTGGKWTTYRLMAEQAVDAAARVAGLSERRSRTASLRLEIEPELGELDDPREIARAVRETMARTVEDILARRTRALLLDARAASAAAPEVAALMAAELGRNRQWQEEQTASFRALARGYLL